MKNKNNLRLLKTARGQIDGIIKMIEDERYCIDISNQIMATTAIMKTVNKNILVEHLHSCVVTEGNSEEREQKFKEIADIVAKLNK